MRYKKATIFVTIDLVLPAEFLFFIAIDGDQGNHTLEVFRSALIGFLQILAMDTPWRVKFNHDNRLEDIKSDEPNDDVPGHVNVAHIIRVGNHTIKGSSSEEHDRRGRIIL